MMKEILKTIVIPCNVWKIDIFEIIDKIKIYNDNDETIKFCNCKPKKYMTNKTHLRDRQVHIALQNDSIKYI